MAVMMTMDLPVSRGDVEALSDAMGVRETVPQGLISHAVTETSGGIHVVDLWESEADFERFRDSQLLPTMEKVMAERGVHLDGPPPDPVIADAFDLVLGH
jgi:hypothetical protein